MSFPTKRPTEPTIPENTPGEVCPSAVGLAAGLCALTSGFSLPHGSGWTTPKSFFFLCLFTFLHY